MKAQDEVEMEAKKVKQSGTLGSSFAMHVSSSDTLGLSYDNAGTFGMFVSDLAQDAEHVEKKIAKRVVFYSEIVLQILQRSCAS